MALIGIIGAMGEGKTLAMTYLALRKYMKGEDIYANYHIKFPAYPNGKSPKIMLVRSIQDVIKMKNGYAILDELWQNIDCRMSGTKKNKFVSNILLKSRKRGINIAFTTQSFHQMDKRIRDVTDFLARPSLSRNETICHLDIFTLPEMRLLKSYKFPTPPLWKTYNTNEEIEPLVDDSELKKEEPPAEDNLPEEITMEEKIKDAFTDDD